jgi:hypothetical protein
MSRRMALPLIPGLLLTIPASAQEAQSTPPITADEAMANAREYWSTTPTEVPDACAQAQAGAGEDVIVVCRQWESGERYTFDRPTRADSSVTGSGAPRPQITDESCLRTRGRENCMMGGWVPPPAIMVDFATLPETPADSEAARRYGGPTDAAGPGVSNEASGD